ncbi:HDOD domain-containing protein [Granulicella sp. dw_53]|uniref:EAL and HDOD domain-containing protein n=1 Tax=Granulicella sp. dw_53 TaxID=2719792 RepID=UPI001BD65FB6|nr:HDOD domain-containing protein [Granulicella sp. dw_53]
MPVEAIVSPVVSADSSLYSSTRFVGRQPILDLQQAVHGYELLFRTSLENSFSGDSDNATRQMIDNVLLLGMDTIAPGSRAFVNCTREAITEELITFLPPEVTVVEVLETVEVDEELVGACVKLKKMGYQIALDDYVPGGGSDRLIELANYVKLDYRACGPEQLRQIQRYLEGAEVALVAEKVETAEEFERARDAGYLYFQGYFFARPTILHSREIPPNLVIYMQLLSAISRPQMDLREIERLVMAETSLCYRVLRVVNSVAVGLRYEVTSVRQALLLLGEDPLRRLLSIATATSLWKRYNVSSELILLALQRARFCELLAPLCGQPGGEQYLIGLISVVDAILQVPMEQVLKMLPLRGEAAGVLLGQDGPAGASLKLIQAYERQDWRSCGLICRRLHLSEAELMRMYVVALQWATKEIRDAGL